MSHVAPHVSHEAQNWSPIAAPWHKRAAYRKRCVSSIEPNLWHRKSQTHVRSVHAPVSATLPRSILLALRCGVESWVCTSPRRLRRATIRRGRIQGGGVRSHLVDDRRPTIFQDASRNIIPHPVHTLSLGKIRPEAIETHGQQDARPRRLRQASQSFQSVSRHLGQVVLLPPKKTRADNKKASFSQP